MDKAHQYLCGLFQSDKRNIEKMSEKVKDSNMQNLNHFISNSPWDSEAVMEKVAKDTNELFIKNNGKTGLLVDESGCKKQGKKSVGVSRQYIGNLGKIDNGQVGVFVSLVQGDKVGIINSRLYLPEEWTSDEARCLEAGIPKEKIEFHTKPELALEMVRSARGQGLSFDWVGGDGLYGHDSKFRYALDDDEEFYVLDVHEDEVVYVEEPQPYIPEKKPGRGRNPSRYQIDVKGVNIRDIVKELDVSQWKEFKFRKGTKGYKRRKVFVKEIYTWNGEDATPRKELLIVSKNLNGTNLKYSFSNDRKGEYSWYELLYMQMQRYWIEQSFKDAKSELGMAEYQVRTWRAWHHHIALTMLALLFMLKQKIKNEDHTPLLSCNDIRFILANTLPQKTNSKQKILELIKHRHFRRKTDLDRYIPNLTK